MISIPTLVNCDVVAVAPRVWARRCMSICNLHPFEPLLSTATTARELRLASD